MNLHMLESENKEQYIWRLGQAKDSGNLDMSWNEIADVINKELNYEDEPFSEAAYRKPYQQAKRFYDAGVFGIKTNSTNIDEVQKNYNTETSINKDGSYSSSRLLEMDAEQSKEGTWIQPKLLENRKCKEHNQTSNQSRRRCCYIIRKFYHSKTNC